MSYKRSRQFSCGLFIIIISVFSLSLSNVFAEHLAEDNRNNEVDSFVRYIPSRSVEAQSGKVEIIESEVNYSYKLKLFDKLPVELTVNPEYVSINNSVAVKLPAHLTGFNANIETTLPLFNLPRTYFHISVIPSFYGDNWTFSRQNFRIPSRWFAIYQPNEKWTFMGGIYVYPVQRYPVQLVHTHPVSLLGGFIYKPNDKLNFNLVPTRPNVTYFINDKLGAYVEYSASSGEFEVTKDGRKGVVLKYEEQHAGVGMQYKFNKSSCAYFTVGDMFKRRMQYRDSLGKVNIKSGLFTEVKMEVSF